MAAPARAIFQHNGVDVYSWEQSLDEVLVYFSPPPGVPASSFACTITPTHVTLGLKGMPPFINEKLSSPCVAKDSFWNLEKSELTLTLTKARKGETWPSVFVGHGALDAAAEAETHKRMLLERFQEEHPGFDFSQASVNGSVPDPRTFMGGLNYTGK